MKYIHAAPTTHICDLFKINTLHSYLNNDHYKLDEIFTKDDIRNIHPYISDSTINRTLKRLRDENKIIVNETLVKEFGLENYVTVTPPIPHQESILLQRSTQLLLLVANNSGNVKGILTGKFFEYLGAKRPIIAIGENDSDLQKIVNHTKCGCFVDYSDEKTLSSFISQSFKDYQSGILSNIAINTEEFSSSNLVKKIIELL